MFTLRGLLRAWSMCAWLTAVVTALAVLVLVPGGVLAAVVARDQITASWWGPSKNGAIAVADDIRAGRLSSPIKSDVPGIELLQVVGPGNEVLSSSAAARGLPPISKARPPPDDPVQISQACPHPARGCMLSMAVRVRSGPDSPVVYAARRIAKPVVAGLLNVLFAVQAITLIALASWAVCRIVRSALRPVRKISTSLERINDGDENARIDESPGQKEITRLARGINNALDRGQRSHQFASDVAHELRNPLAAVRLKIEEAQLHGLQTDLDDLLCQQLRDLDHIESIIDDLLTLSRLGQGGTLGRRPVDMAALVKESVGRRDDRVPVQLRLEPGVFVNGVGTQISRILTNLLDNGQRHVKKSIMVEVRRNGDVAEMAVDDDGDGVPPAERERIFERFARSEKSLRINPCGAGLGLAITRDIARAHGGTIHVEDSADGGARFVLRLPAIDPPD